MAWFRCIGNSSGGANILSGTTDPTSSQGNNGQIYLKYSDLANKYTFKEYLEVGSSGDAYIMTGSFFTENGEFETKIQWIDSPTNNTVLFESYTPNKDTGIQNYGGEQLFSVGGSVYRNTLDYNAHIYKATQNDMLIDNISVGTTPNWENYSPTEIGIFKTPAHSSATNARFYYAKIWDNDSLVHYFVPVVRIVDSVIGILDVVNGSFKTNSGAGSFTVGDTITPTIGNPIINSFAKVNNSWQSLIGTNIDDIGSATKTEVPIDMSNITVYRASSMFALSDDTDTILNWDNGSQITLTIAYTIPIDVTNISKLKYDLQTRSCWGNGQQALKQNWYVQIGIMSTFPTTYLDGAYNDLDFVAGNYFPNSNTDYGTQEIDVSNLSGNYYFVVNAHGWNASIKNLRYK